MLYPSLFCEPEPCVRWQSPFFCGNHVPFSDAVFSADTYEACVILLSDNQDGGPIALRGYIIYQKTAKSQLKKEKKPPVSSLSFVALWKIVIFLPLSTTSCGWGQNHPNLRNGVLTPHIAVFPFLCPLHPILEKRENGRCKSQKNMI